MSDLNRLFYWHGIAENYFNYKGDLVNVSQENRVNLLRTMQVDVDSEMAVTKAAFEVDVAPWLHWLPALITNPENEEHCFNINLNPRELDTDISWSLFSDGTLLNQGTFKPGDLLETGDYLFQNIRYTRRKVVLKEVDLSPGYYDLVLQNGHREGRTNLAVIPDTTWQPSWSASGERLWGVIVQLYTLRSERNWGIGDFTDLKNLIVNVAHSGADLIGLNPLHTLQPNIEENCSPYSPSDRRFLNPLYLDLEHEADYMDSGIAEHLKNDHSHLKEIAALRHTSHVDYLKVKNIKYRVFQDMFLWFKKNHIEKKSSRSEEFLDYFKSGGDALASLGLYEAMYNNWPDAIFKIKADDNIWLQGNASEKLDKLLNDNRDSVLFHIYLQWLSKRQLSECQELTTTSGMKLGLVRDLAVAANGAGCEVKSNGKLFCQGASVGAPPDPFSDLGQNWGMPPMDPAALRESGYKHYIKLLRANMQFCGALRIDHAMSLLRLWWCPPNKTADYGAYVYYPFEDLLGLLKLESHLNQCVTIGEDLGVVPEEFRSGMAKAGVFANKVFYFEKENYLSFKKPQDYDAHALAMVNNHDVPTLKSWWDATDLLLRKRLQLFEAGSDYEKTLAEREEEKRQAYYLLKDQNLLPHSWEARSLEDEADSELIYALLKLNSRVNSKMFVLQLEDLQQMDSPTNVPGTYKEYPNWQRKLDLPLEKIFSEPSVEALLANIYNERKNRETNE